MFLWSRRLRVLARCTLIWVAVTAGACCVALVALPGLLAVVAAPRADAEPTFGQLLVALCAAIALGTAGWLWWVTTDVVVTLARRRASRAGRVGMVRALVLAACGAAVLGSTTATAAAAPQSAVVISADRDPATGPARAGGERALAGLPLPDRPLGEWVDRSDLRRIMVRPGDSLWAIAAEQLGPATTVVQITAYWHRVHALNADVIGPDPDLIRPGQQLRLPPVT